jgi:hypothetical protein
VGFTGWFGMVNDDINKDLNTYIKDKRSQQRGSFFDIFKRKNKGVQKMTDEDHNEEHNEPMAKPEEIDDEYDMMDEDQPKTTEPKEGLVRRMLKKVGLMNDGRDEEELDDEDYTETKEEETEELHEDVKKVLKMSYDWLKYMPDHKLQSFKDSEDFKLYKDVLKKYGLAKEKEKTE